MEFVPISPPKNWKTMPVHPLAELMQFGKGIDLPAFTAHMKKWGYRKENPLYVVGEELFDGRHRRYVAAEAGETPTFMRIFGATPEELKALAMDKIFRQHVDMGQRSLYAAGLITAGPGRPKDGGTTVSAADAAELAGVSEREVVRAKRIKEKGTEALQEAVAAGDISVTDAAAILESPAKVQNQAVKDVMEGKTKTAAQSVEKQTIFCSRCERVGKPVENCPMCDRARERAKQRKKLPKLLLSSEYEDAFKNKIPNSLKDAWADPWLQKAYDFLCISRDEFLGERLADKFHKKGKYHPFIKSKDVLDGLAGIQTLYDKIIDHIKEFRPAGVCPSCEGKKCGDCQMSGLVPRTVYEKLKRGK